MEIKGGVDGKRMQGVAPLVCFSLFLPVTVKVEMPFLVIGSGIDMGAVTA